MGSVLKFCFSYAKISYINFILFNELDQTRPTLYDSVPASNDCVFISFKVVDITLKYCCLDLNPTGFL